MITLGRMLSGGYLVELTVEEKKLLVEPEDVFGAIHTLAMLGLQSNLYQDNLDFREAVDNALALLKNANII